MQRALIPKIYIDLLHIIIIFVAFSLSLSLSLSLSGIQPLLALDCYNQKPAHLHHLYLRRIIIIITGENDSS
ncbi:hypothetical protein L6452_18687 [Arctium lappa]|uniref:Uncharacterized protein n=1 Tax=Arctium lappa TaxID=4217 RepID=A0ACB9C6X8_ARCLA|nr:hypothetical protein L6452_18687 [Arctium lappa]